MLIKLPPVICITRYDLDTVQDFTIMISADDHKIGLGICWKMSLVENHN